MDPKEIIKFSTIYCRAKIKKGSNCRGNRNSYKKVDARKVLDKSFSKFKNWDGEKDGEKNTRTIDIHYAEDKRNTFASFFYYLKAYSTDEHFPIYATREPELVCTRIQQLHSDYLYTTYVHI